MKQRGRPWGISSGGAKLLQPACAKIHFPRAIQEHDLRLSALRIHLESAGLARGWIPEHEVRAKVASEHAPSQMKYQTIPDALMAVTAQDSKVVVAVELELSPKNQTRYREILFDYVVKNSLWGVWYVAKTATIGRQVAKAYSGIRRSKKEPYFFWSLLDEVMKDPLRAEAHGPEGTFKLQDLWCANLHSPAPAQSTLTKELAPPLLSATSENLA